MCLGAQIHSCLHWVVCFWSSCLFIGVGHSSIKWLEDKNMAKNELTEMEKLLVDFMKILGFSLDDVIEVYEELSTEDEVLEMIWWLEPFVDQNKIPTREQVMSFYDPINFPKRS